MSRPQPGRQRRQGLSPPSGWHSRHPGLVHHLGGGRWRQRRSRARSTRERARLTGSGRCMQPQRRAQRLLPPARPPAQRQAVDVLEGGQGQQARLQPRQSRAHGAVSVPGAAVLAAPQHGCRAGQEAGLSRWPQSKAGHAARVQAAVQPTAGCPSTLPLQVDSRSQGTQAPVMCRPIKGGHRWQPCSLHARQAGGHCRQGGRVCWKAGGQSGRADAHHCWRTRGCTLLHAEPHAAPHLDARASLQAVALCAGGAFAAAVAGHAAAGLWVRLTLRRQEGGGGRRRQHPSVARRQAPAQAGVQQGKTLK